MNDKFAKQGLQTVFVTMLEGKFGSKDSATVEEELENVWTGKKQPKEALAAAQKAADETLKPYNAETSLKLP